MKAFGVQIFGIHVDHSWFGHGSLPVTYWAFEEMEIIIVKAWKLLWKKQYLVAHNQLLLLHDTFMSCQLKEHMISYLCRTDVVYFWPGRRASVCKFGKLEVSDR